MENFPVKSVQKALSLLDRIAFDDVSRQGVSLSELAKQFGMPQNTTHNLLKSLISGGYVALRERGVYVAGPKCAQLGRVAQCTETRVQQRVMAALHRFVDAEGEACVCSILANGERLMVGVVDSTHTVRVSRATFSGDPFFAKPTGRMLAASASKAELQQILSRQGMPGQYWDDIQDEAHLYAELAKLRTQGWCLVNNEQQELVAIACPITDGVEPAWGTLAMYAPAYRCSSVRRQQLLERLRDIAIDLFRDIAIHI